MIDYLFYSAKFINVLRFVNVIYSIVPVTIKIVPDVQCKTIWYIQVLQFKLILQLTGNKIVRIFSQKYLKIRSGQLCLNSRPTIAEEEYYLVW